ncbi:hypothetical protein N7456_010476 [Penicillium angulare]|uniref:Uncharacterized protein n=1 Tax=Penicillium angulare TaxID=116970 RepID=A0A9W9F6X9_9EURO|nr:hypothetical protein N7456_010476 [Penicillium angulare]
MDFSKIPLLYKPDSSGALKCHEPSQKLVSSLSFRHNTFSQYRIANPATTANSLTGNEAGFLVTVEKINRETLATDET